MAVKEREMGGKKGFEKGLSQGVAFWALGCYTGRGGQNQTNPD